jgi:ferredoxin-NADP reductase
VKAIRAETANVKTLTLTLPAWRPHRAGQHYDVRLTAADGYSAQRSYSVASEPEREGEIDITVERIRDGEVSLFLDDAVRVGDRFEVRGPIGGYFVWDASLGGPLLLVAGGAGVVPLMAMLRHRAAARSNAPARLLYSSRTIDDVIYRDELDAMSKDDGVAIVHTLTRAQPPGWNGYARRIDDRMLAEVAQPLGRDVLAYICGPTALVEAAADGLERIGLPAERIRTERFGPTGA